MINKVNYTIKNLNREKLFQKIINVSCLGNVIINEHELKFSVPIKSEKKIDKILKDNSITILNKNKAGFNVFLKGSLFRIGVIVPIIAFFIALIFNNLYVYKYDVIGNEFVSDSEIIKILEENNVQGVMLKSKINITNIENALLEINEVSMVSVIVYGNTLVVNIKEKVMNEEYENQNLFTPLISEYNGIITEISLVQGTLLVSVGQTVQVGQQLVAPYVTDTTGKMLSVKPMADIKADVFFTTNSSIADKNISYQDTENKIIKKEISLFNKIIYTTNNECEFKYYREEIVVEDLVTGILLPLKYTTITYVEQKEVVSENYFIENKTNILNDCKQKTRQLIKDYEIIKEEYYNIESVGGINYVAYTIIVNKSIC